MITKIIKWLTEQVGSIYVWGGQGEKNPPEEWIRRRETSSKNADRVMALYRKQKAAGRNPIAAYDCSGLIVKFLLDNGLLDKDTTAAGLYRLCKGIQKQALQTGDFVFRSSDSGIYHVGVYVGGSEVIHARGRDHGVVKENIDANGGNYWNKFGRFEALKQNNQNQEGGKCIVQLSILKNGHRGNEVKALQLLLNGYGFDCGKADGSFGAKTEAAVKTCQKAFNASVDGIVGNRHGQYF